MAGLVLLDNTILTNFALLHRVDLVLELWPGAGTTPAVLAEYAAGVEGHGLAHDAWSSLVEVSLTPDESALAGRLRQRLGAGESSCIAVAYHRDGLFASDDADARRVATAFNVPVSGTIGVLLLSVHHERLTLHEGNTLLTRLIEAGYRSPVERLD